MDDESAVIVRFDSVLASVRFLTTTRSLMDVLSKTPRKHKPHRVAAAVMDEV